MEYIMEVLILLALFITEMYTYGFTSVQCLFVPITFQRIGGFLRILIWTSYN